MSKIDGLKLSEFLLLLILNKIVFLSIEKILLLELEIESLI